MSIFKRIAPLIFIAVIILIFFNKIILQESIFVTGDFLRSDTLNQNLPFKYEYWLNIRQGQLPLWTDKIFSGFPLLAEGQTGMFYPVNLLFFSTLPFLQAYNLSQVTNFLIAAIGMYLLARKFNMSVIASIFTAITFSLSSFFVFHITHHNIIAAAVWMPLLALSLIKLTEKPGFRSVIVSALVIAASVFAGSLQITFYMMVGLMLYVVLTGFKRKEFDLRPVLNIIAAVILALALGAVQLLPTLELVNNSTRAQGVKSLALDSLPYHPRNLATFIYPYVYGDPGEGSYPHFGDSWGMFWENTAYVGLFPLGFAIIALVKIKRKEIKILGLLLLISLLLSLGKYGPFFWIYYLPVFNYFRVTSRFLLVATFALTLLAGFGLDTVRKYLDKKYPKYAVYAVLGLILLISTADLFNAGYGYNPTEQFSKVLQEPETMNYLDKKGRVFSVAPFIAYDEINRSGWRDNNVQNLNHSNALDANINMLWGIKNYDGYAGLFLDRNEILKNSIYSGFELTDDGRINIEERSMKLLGISHVKYLISVFDMDSQQLKYIGKAGKEKEYKIYENLFFSDSGLLTEDIGFVNRQGVSTALSQQDFDPLKTVILENLILNSSEQTVQGQFQNLIESISDEDKRRVFRIESGKRQWFIIPDSFYPGWQASINGEPANIYPADSAFRAILVPKGRSEVIFEYKPASFFWGTIITGATIISIASIAVVRGFTSKYQKDIK